MLITIIGTICVPIMIWIFSKFEKTKEKAHSFEIAIKDLEKELEIQKTVIKNLKSNIDIFTNLISNNLNSNNNEKSRRLREANGSQRQNKQ